MEISSTTNQNSAIGVQKLNRSQATDVTKSNLEGLHIASLTYSSLSIEVQSSLTDENHIQEPQSFEDFLASIGYEGDPIASLSQDEAKTLVSDEGFFGIDQTAKRLSDFVLNGAGQDIDKLRAGRSGIIEGFKQAEALWGEKLPQISYDTLDKALESIDKAMSEMGYSVIDEAI